MKRFPLNKSLLVQCLFFSTLMLTESKQLQAQTNVTNSKVQFVYNFTTTTPADVGFSLVTENNNDGTFDFVVLQKENQIFRFSGLNTGTDIPVSFSLVSDNKLIFPNLPKVKDDTFREALIENADLTTAFIGFLECKTSQGSTKRIQVAKFEEENSDEPVSIR